jgi:hypothetical protein
MLTLGCVSALGGAMPHVLRDDLKSVCEDILIPAKVFIKNAKGWLRMRNHARLKLTILFSDALRGFIKSNARIGGGGLMIYHGGFLIGPIFAILKSEIRLSSH